MKKIILLSIILSFTFSGKSQQDAQYNLYQFNQLLINPAYAGARDILSAILLSRQQWVGIDGAPKTNCLSLHGPVINKNIGIGLTITNDEMGPRNVISVFGNAAYILRINSKMKLSFGLNAGFNRYQFNFNKVTFYNSEFPSSFNQNQTTNALDVNGGLYLKSQTFFAGMSMTHINSPSIYKSEASSIEYHLSPHMFFNLGKSFQINQNLVFAPTLLVKYSVSSLSYDFNFNFLINKKMWLGAFYRSSYGPGGLMQYFVTNKFKVGYSYDTGLGNQLNFGSSHELMLSLDFGSTKSNKTRTTNPRFL
jgi:type IX secretion system PorP/SprF family membrane protein